MAMLCNDGDFGPQVDGQCRGGYDFTLLFEQSMLWIAPSAVLLLCTPVRLAQLYRQTVKATFRRLQSIKLAIASMYIGLQLSLFAVWTAEDSPKTVATLPGLVLGLLGSIAVLSLQQIEHSRSVQPSDIVSVYLFVSTLFDAAQFRTMWLLGEQPSLSRMLLIIIILKVVLFVLEARSKRGTLVHPYSSLPSEPVSGLLNRWSFWWLNSLLWQGSRRILQVEDLSELDPRLDSQRLVNNLEIKWKNSNQKRAHSFLFAVFSSLKWPLMSAILPRLCQSAFTFAQPFLISRIIDFVKEDEDSKSKNIGHGLIGATALIYTGLAFSIAVYKHKTYRLITMVRGSCVPFIYAKTLKLNASATADSAALTLMSTDIDRIALGLTFGHEMWASTLDVCIATFLLWRQVGIACVAPAVVAVVCSLGGVQIARAIGDRTRSWVSAVQSRIDVTSKVLRHIKPVKMMATAQGLRQKIQDLRNHEVKLAKHYLRLDACMNAFANAPTLISPALTFLIAAFVPIGGSSGLLTSSRAFTALSLIMIMTSPLAIMLNAIPNFFAAVACFGRIQDYLLLDEKLDKRHMRGTASNLSVDSFNSCQLGDKGASFTVEKLETAVINEKYSQISKDAMIQMSEVDVSHSAGGECVLSDLNFELSRGSFTMVIGPVGSGKSTLLKSLLGESFLLAGTLHMSSSSVHYCGQEPWLVNHSIRDNILKGSEYDESWYQDVVHACALQPDLERLTTGDNTLAGPGGNKLSGGQRQRVSMARALYSKQSIILMDDVLSGLDAKTEELVFSRTFGRDGILKRVGSTTVLVTHSIRHVKSADFIIVLDKNGTVQRQGSYDDIKNEESLRHLLLEEKENNERDQTATTKRLETHQVDEDVSDNQLQRQQGDTQIYSYYFRAIGIKYFLTLLVLTILYVFCQRFMPVWLGFWVKRVETDPGRGTNALYGSVYLLLALIGLVFFYFAILFTFQKIVPRSASGMHWNLLKATMSAPYPFFAKADTGTIVNRFSQDMSLLDMDLPSHGIETVFQLVNGIVQFVLIATGSSYIAAITPGVMAVIYFISKYYLRTSRQMRILDLEAKSPLYTHILDTYSGLLTIRASGWQSRYMSNNHALVQRSQRPYYLMYCIQRWLNIVLALTVAGIAVILVTLAVELKKSTNGTAIGVALLNILTFNNTLSQLIVAWTQLETSLGAVARIRDFTTSVEAEEDEDGPLTRPPVNWPSSGRVEFHNLYASYEKNGESVLRNLCLTIAPGMKIGVCGRTGSGKSSLLLALFRMIHTNSGSITIDGVDISELPIETVRKAISVIPQEPLILPGTVRSNLSMDNSYSESSVKTCLERVSLWTYIESKGGLDAEMSSDFLSHGQQQLFSVARCLLQAPNAKILVLDEATSNLDEQSQDTVMDILSKEFADKTIIMVAHRLQTLQHFDKIAALERGRMVEFDSPSNLLERDSLFKELWDSQ